METQGVQWDLEPCGQYVSCGVLGAFPSQGGHVCVWVCRAVSSPENPGACAGACWKMEAKLAAGWPEEERGGDF